MKPLLLLTLFLSFVISDECPAKLLKITSTDVKEFFQGYYKKVGKIKVNCDYSHDSNIFNLEHVIKVNATFKKRKLSFEAKTHSSMFNLFNFTDLDGKICHSKFGSEKTKKDVKLIKSSFLKKFAKDINDKDIKRSDKKGLVCYMAKTAKKKRTLL